MRLRFASFLEALALRLTGGVHALRCRVRECPCWIDGHEAERRKA
jgi:hypothetical protein